MFILRIINWLVFQLTDKKLKYGRLTFKRERLKSILTLLTFALCLDVAGQTGNEDCDSIYKYTETFPQYKNDKKDLMEYFRSDLQPILSNCYKRDSSLITNMILQLTIGKTGRVIDLEFKKIHASEKCKKELREKILTMSGWAPAKHQGLPVCSKFSWSIACLRWE